MQPPIIVEVEIAADPTPRLFRIGVVAPIANMGDTFDGSALEPVSET